MKKIKKDLSKEENRLMVSVITFDTNGKNGIFIYLPSEVDHTLLEYDNLFLPPELRDEFDFWYKWYKESIQAKKYGMDWRAFEAYGLGLAINLKRWLLMIKMPYEVYFGALYSDQGEVKIIFNEDNGSVSLLGHLNNNYPNKG